MPARPRREDALEVNGSAVVNIINAARSVGAALIQVSTDFVFDGTSREPYGEKAEPAPLSVYGESKRLGELAMLEYERGLVVRTSWLFGPGGANFVATMAGLIAEGRKPLRVVGDQIGCPTYTPYLARAIWDLLELRINDVVSTIVIATRSPGTRLPARSPRFWMTPRKSYLSRARSWHAQRLAPRTRCWTYQSSSVWWVGRWRVGKKD